MNLTNERTSRALTAGLNTLSDPDIRVSSVDIEALANFKEILRAILNSQLVLATPDRIKPEEVIVPNKEPEDST